MAGCTFSDSCSAATFVSSAGKRVQRFSNRDKGIYFDLRKPKISSVKMQKGQKK
jgi:hypothetical protein